MSSKVPTIKQINWISIIPHVLIMGLLIIIWYLIHPKEAFLFGTVTYLLLSFLLKKFIPKNHRNGIKKNNIKNFEGAINDFKKNKWIDQYRFITLLSSSKVSYQEMALANIAFCYGQIGNGKKSKEYYKKTLQEFPKSELAQSALNMIDSITKSNTTSAL